MDEGSHMKGDFSALFSFPPSQQRIHTDTHTYTHTRTHTRTHTINTHTRTHSAPRPGLLVGLSDFLPRHLRRLFHGACGGAQPGHQPPVLTLGHGDANAVKQERGGGRRREVGRERDGKKAVTNPGGGWNKENKINAARRISNAVLCM